MTPAHVPMPSGCLLLVSATAMEADPLLGRLDGRDLDLGWGPARHGTLHGRQVVVAYLGVGKVNTAAGLAVLLPRLHPWGVLQFGIGGAFVGSFLSVGEVVAASAEIHTDCGAGEGESWQDMEALGFPLVDMDPPVYNVIPTDRDWSGKVASTAGVPLLRFATNERVTTSFDAAERFQARFDVSVESMEGAAAAQVCLSLGVPFAELRGISNIVGERDKRAWNVSGAVRAVNEAVAAAVRFADPPDHAAVGPGASNSGRQGDRP